ETSRALANTCPKNLLLQLPINSSRCFHLPAVDRVQMDPELVTVVWATGGVVASCGCFIVLTALLCRLSQYCHRRLRKMKKLRQRRQQLSQVDSSLQRQSLAMTLLTDRRKSRQKLGNEGGSRGDWRLSLSAAQASISRQAALAAGFDVRQQAAPSIELDCCSGSSCDSQIQSPANWKPKQKVQQTGVQSSAVAKATSAACFDSNVDDWPPIGGTGSAAGGGPSGLGAGDRGGHRRVTSSSAGAALSEADLLS
ncbi:hypothetical protein BOX15_Mlig015034g3, partial [Macrostomum lignano]